MFCVFKGGIKKPAVFNSFRSMVGASQILSGVTACSLASSRVYPTHSDLGLSVRLPPSSCAVELQMVVAVVIQVLIFVCEEQEGCMKLGGKRSTTFSLTNGTRQEPVLSPLLFSVYLDDH